MSLYESMVRVLYAKKGICLCGCSLDDFAVHLCTARGVKCNVAKTQAHVSVRNGVPQLRTGCGLVASRYRAGIAPYRAACPPPPPGPLPPPRAGGGRGGRGGKTPPPRPPAPPPAGGGPPFFLKKKKKGGGGGPPAL